MQLAAYLSREGISLNAFAKLLGAKNARTVQRYTKHARIPSGPMMTRIMHVTGGAVQPNDFFPSAAE